MSTWTEERVERLKILWQKGKTASQIAQELGAVTRNAVIGKVHRLGLSGRPSPIKKQIKKTEEIIKRTSRVEKPKVTNKKKVKAIKDYLPADGGRSMLELKESMCKWPIGDPRSDNFKFCGEKSESGIPYCTHHAQMAYQTPSRKRAKINIDKLASL